MSFFSKTILVSFLYVFSLPIHANIIDWSEDSFTHFSKAEPLKNILESIAAEQNIPVVVSNKVKGVISAYFKEETLELVLNKLISTHGLITFFDGNVLYIYKSEETQTGTVTLAKATIDELENYLRTNGFLDDNVKWIADKANNSVAFSGPKRFVDIVLGKAKRLDQENATRIFEVVSSTGIPTFTTNPLSKNNKIKKIYIYKNGVAEVNISTKQEINPKLGETNE